jgi:hypothetical protein
MSYHKRIGKEVEVVQVGTMDLKQSQSGLE